MMKTMPERINSHQYSRSRALVAMKNLVVAGKTLSFPLKKALNLGKILTMMKITTSTDTAQSTRG